MAAFVPSFSTKSSFTNNTTSICWSSNVSSTCNLRSFTSTPLTTTPLLDVRMVASVNKNTKSKTTKKDTTVAQTQISLNALALISFIRGHKSIFHPGNGFTTMTKALCQKNDTARLFTPLDQLETNRSLLSGYSAAAYIFSNSDGLIQSALDTLATHYSPASDDEVIADILNYNMTACLRAISYGAAVQSTDFVHFNNVCMMKELHEDIGIPAKAIASALDAVKDIVVSGIEQDDDVVKGTADCFDTLRDALC